MAVFGNTLCLVDRMDAFLIFRKVECESVPLLTLKQQKFYKIVQLLQIVTRIELALNSYLDKL